MFKFTYPSRDLIRNSICCSPKISSCVPATPLACTSQARICVLLTVGCINETMAPVSTMNNNSFPSISTVNRGSVTIPPLLTTQCGPDCEALFRLGLGVGLALPIPFKPYWLRGHPLWVCPNCLQL